MKRCGGISFEKLKTKESGVTPEPYTFLKAYISKKLSIELHLFHLIPVLSYLALRQNFNYSGFSFLGVSCERNHQL